MPTRPFVLGRARPLTGGGSAAAAPLEVPAHHLVTHGVVVGMTGSGKTGLVVVLVEEALRSGIPVLMIDIKGDLPNLFFTFPELSPAEFEPWIDEAAAARDGKSPAEVAGEVAARWRNGLSSSGLGAADVASLRARMAPRILTPGTTAGEPINVLSALEKRSPLWDEDEEGAVEELSASLSLLLRLIGRDADPSKSREHVLLAHLCERRLRAGQETGLEELLADLAEPPIASVGALSVDEFYGPKERKELARELNTLLASPTFATWRKGAPLDVAAWLKPEGGKTPAAIVSVAHLEDDERLLVLGLLFDQLLSWVRGLAGTSDLRALVVFDEVFGFLPPHPATPPTKRPLLALLKQARAFGVGIVLATQNPMDLDYKALSNAGIWFVGRLQTDADRERVVEGLAGSESGAGGVDAATLSATLKALPPRAFFLRDVHMTPNAQMVETRFSLSWLRGPVTRREITRLVRVAAPQHGAPPGGAAPAVRAPEAQPAVEAQAVASVARTAAAQPAESARAESARAESAQPRPPEGWKSLYAHPPAPAMGGFVYVPWVAAQVVAHVRDAKLGVAVNQAQLIAAPLSPDGRPDLEHVARLDPALLSTVPAPAARFAALPAALAKKTVAQAAARALREHVYRTTEVAVAIHKELGLTQDDAEPYEAFVARCQAAAARLAEAEQQEVRGRFAPKLARLHDRIAAARARYGQAEADIAALPGVVGTALLGIVAGRGTARRAETQRGKAGDKLERARKDWTEADAALRELVAAEAAELAAVEQRPRRAHEGIEVKRLVPKKNDVEVTDVAVAWAVSAG